MQPRVRGPSVAGIRELKPKNTCGMSVLYGCNLVLGHSSILFLKDFLLTYQFTTQNQIHCLCKSCAFEVEQRILLDFNANEFGQESSKHKEPLLLCAKSLGGQKDS